MWKVCCTAASWLCISPPEVGRLIDLCSPSIGTNSVTTLFAHLHIQEIHHSLYVFFFFVLPLLPSFSPQSPFLLLSHLPPSPLNFSSLSLSLVLLVSFPPLLLTLILSVIGHHFSQYWPIVCFHLPWLVLMKSTQFGLLHLHTWVSTSIYRTSTVMYTCV